MQYTVCMADDQRSAIGLRCLRCGGRVELSEEAYLCPNCGAGPDPSDAGVLDVEYDYDRARAELLDADGHVRSGRRDVFRYLPVLPVDGLASTLATGGTPLVRADRLAREIGVGALQLKDETRNPSRALKDRATAIGVTRAIAQGRPDVSCASAGNAAISLAAFAAHARLRAHAFVPSDASDVRLEWLAALGADVIRSEGDYDTAYGEAEAMRSEGWYSRNCAYNPFLVEGKKTCGLEIGEQLRWQVPDLVVSPVGDACTLAAIGKGFRELRRLGVTSRLPRLIGVQAAGQPAMVNRFRADDGAAAPEPMSGNTDAASIDVRHPRNARRLLLELEASDGELLTVEDDRMRDAQLELARGAGVVAELASAAALAGLRALAERESLTAATAVLVVTGGRTDKPITKGDSK